ncbi:hypothetical protein FBQ97_06640 [Acidobacteria bacterium ACD]|nr:MAG: hypothetical protein EDX89_04490 [Acidobacteriota bacterium]MCE7956399.1 hypothetical protein [Acidobacteria bacterium ACB2]MDL1949474.1 hypothetical protein [Acidobacteria bacterium ACD]
MRRSILASLVLLASCGTSPVVAPTARDHSTGPVDAKVTVIEYADYQCPACASAQPVVKQLIGEYSDRVRFVFRDFPLEQIHPNALAAAEAAEAAETQGKYWEMHDKLFETQEEWKDLADPIPTFTGYATALGIDGSKFRAELTNHTYRPVVKASAAGALALGVNSTPTFFINGKRLRGAPRVYSEFQALVEWAIRDASTSASPSSDTGAPAAPATAAPTSARPLTPELAPSGSSVPPPPTTPQSLPSSPAGSAPPSPSPSSPR